MPRDLAAEAEARREALSATDSSLATTYPYLIEVVEELGASGYDYTEQFEQGLEQILNAIEQLRPWGAAGRVSRTPRQPAAVSVWVVRL